MGEIAVVAYRPKPGCDAELLALAREHHPILRKEGLVTDRPPIVSRAGDGTIVEIFEWVDGGPERAHGNDAVRSLWQSECQSLFAGFAALN